MRTCTILMHLIRFLEPKLSMPSLARLVASMRRAYKSSSDSMANGGCLDSKSRLASAKRGAWPCPPVAGDRHETLGHASQPRGPCLLPRGGQVDSTAQVYYCAAYHMGHGNPQCQIQSYFPCCHSPTIFSVPLLVWPLRPQPQAQRHGRPLSSRLRPYAIASCRCLSLFVPPCGPRWGGQVLADALMLVFIN